MKDFAKQIKNKVTRKYRRKPPKKTYLDYTITTNDAEDEEIVPGVSPVFSNVHTRINNLAERCVWHKFSYVILSRLIKMCR